jgi:hypothetical protein
MKMLVEMTFIIRGGANEKCLGGQGEEMHTYNTFKNSFNSL